MIRIAVVDDHYAVRLGLEAALNAQPDMVAVGAVGRAGDVAPLLYRTAPDVLIVDYRLPDEDGLSLCLRLRGGTGTPALLLHSAFADEWLTVPTLIAGADGIVPKGANGLELAEAIRAVARGRSAMPSIAPELLAAAADPVAPEDRPILESLANGVSPAEIARTLGITHAELRARRARMLTALRAPATG